jgi:nucleotide-binding universal stress UspA family protein
MTMHLPKAEPESTNPPSRILVPLDGSAIAEQALWLAAHMARRRRAIVRIVTVHVPGPSAIEAQSDDGSSRTGRETHRALQRYLDRKSMEVAIAHGVSCESAVLHGWPPRALADDVRAHGVGLVVMTAHGWSGVNHRWIGSVTDALLARILVPILVLRGDCGPTPARFFRILVAQDHSPGAAHVLEQALDLTAAETGASFALCTIVESAGRLPRRTGDWSESEPTASHLRRRQAAADALERRAAELRREGFTAETHAVVAHSAAAGLLQLADQLGSDMIVVGTHRPRATPRLRLGSVADKVVRGAQQPVMVIPVRKRAVRTIHHRRIQRRASRPDHSTVASASGRIKETSR